MRTDWIPEQVAVRGDEGMGYPRQAVSDDRPYRIVAAHVAGIVLEYGDGSRRSMTYEEALAAGITV